MEDHFVKRSVTAPPGFYAVEAAGLRWLAAAGGALVAEPVDVTDDRIVLPRLAQVAPTPELAEEFGRRLAATHRAGAPWFGAAPPGVADSGFIAELPLPMRTSPPHGTSADAPWPPSPADRRSPSARRRSRSTSHPERAAGGTSSPPERGQAATSSPSAGGSSPAERGSAGGSSPVERGSGGGSSPAERGSAGGTSPVERGSAGRSSQLARGERTASYPERGAAGVSTASATSPPPAASDWGEFYATLRLRPYADGAWSEALDAVCDRLEAGDESLTGPPEPPSRLHGDLWSGNVVWTPEGGVLIDPAAHGGHRETDLAMLALFGLPYLDRVLAAYDEAYPLADGWRERVDLHQLHPLLVHACLFGGSYATHATSVAERYA